MDKDKPKKAVAVKYRPPDDTVPKVVAKGRGEIAERILRVAREHNVPVREDPDLTELLSALDINQEIPTELYQVVAEVLAWVYRLNRNDSLKNLPV
jgi:flagellar biosynthesis protein